MARPYDTTPLFQAVIHALTASTGKPRALPPDRLFTLGRPADLLKEPTAPTVYRRPRCFVMPPVSQPVDTQMLTTIRRVEATVEIRCWYYAHTQFSREWFETVERAERDAQLVGAALTYPGALQYAPDGSETGLDGEALRSDGGRHRVVGPAPLPREGDKILQVTHVFRTTCELTAPSTAT